MIVKAKISLSVRLGISCSEPNEKEIFPCQAYRIPTEKAGFLNGEKVILANLIVLNRPTQRRLKVWYFALGIANYVSFDNAADTEEMRDYCTEEQFYRKTDSLQYDLPKLDY